MATDTTSPIIMATDNTATTAAMTAKAIPDRQADITIDTGSTSTGTNGQGILVDDTSTVTSNNTKRTGDDASTIASTAKTPDSKLKADMAFNRLYNATTAASKNNNFANHKRMEEERKKKLKLDPKDSEFLSYGNAILSKNPAHKQSAPTVPRKKAPLKAILSRFPKLASSSGSTNSIGSRSRTPIDKSARPQRTLRGTATAVRANGVISHKNPPIDKSSRPQRTLRGTAAAVRAKGLISSKNPKPNGRSSADSVASNASNSTSRSRQSIEKNSRPNRSADSVGSNASNRTPRSRTSNKKPKPNIRSSADTLASNASNASNNTSRSKASNKKNPRPPRTLGGTAKAVLYTKHQKRLAGKEKNSRPNRRSTVDSVASNASNNTSRSKASNKNNPRPQRTLSGTAKAVFYTKSQNSEKKRGIAKPETAGTAKAVISSQNTDSKKKRDIVKPETVEGTSPMPDSEKKPDIAKAETAEGTSLVPDSEKKPDIAKPESAERTSSVSNFNTSVPSESPSTDTTPNDISPVRASAKSEPGTPPSSPPRDSFTSSLPSSIGKSPMPSTLRGVMSPLTPDFRRKKLRSVERNAKISETKLVLPGKRDLHHWNEDSSDGITHMLGIPGETELEYLFQQIDENSTGKLSLVELYTAVQILYPNFDISSAAFDSAYKSCQGVNTSNENDTAALESTSGSVEQNEFSFFIHYMVYYHNLSIHFALTKTETENESTESKNKSTENEEKQEEEQTTHTISREKFSKVSQDIKFSNLLLLKDGETDAIDLFDILDINRENKIQFHSLCHYLATTRPRFKVQQTNGEEKEYQKVLDDILADEEDSEIPKDKSLPEIETKNDDAVVDTELNNVAPSEDTADTNQAKISMEETLVEHEVTSEEEASLEKEMPPEEDAPPEEKIPSQEGMPVEKKISVEEIASEEKSEYGSKSSKRPRVNLLRKISSGMRRNNSNTGSVDGSINSKSSLTTETLHKNGNPDKGNAVKNMKHFFENQETESDKNLRQNERRRSLFKPKTWSKSFYKNQFITLANTGTLPPKGETEELETLEKEEAKI